MTNWTMAIAYKNSNVGISYISGQLNEEPKIKIADNRSPLSLPFFLFLPPSSPFFLLSLFPFFSFPFLLFADGPKICRRTPKFADGPNYWGGVTPPARYGPGSDNLI